MEKRRLELNGAPTTMLVTLFAKGLDSRLARPSLGDAWAGRVMDQIEFDYRRHGLNDSRSISVAMRAKSLDKWVRIFLRDNPCCTVLHLGCGLDSRCLRIDPGPGVRWIEVDFPQVIALRHELVPEHAGCRQIGASLAQTEWLDQVANDLPVMVVAEGVLPYLEAAWAEALIKALVERFPAGRLAFDGYGKLGLWLLGRSAVIRESGVRLGWSLDDPLELERLSPRLKFVEEFLDYDPADLEQLPWLSRVLMPLWRRWPAFRRLGRLLLYRF